MNKKDCNILALDLANNCGYAIYKNGQIVDFGSWDLLKHKRGEVSKPKTQLNALLGWVVRTYDIQHIVMEGAYIPVNDGRENYVSLNAAKSLLKLHGVAELFCELNNIPFSEIQPMTAKGFMFGANRRMKRQILKSKMIVEVERLGYVLPKQHTDDVADAIGILCTYLNEKIECS